MTLGKNIVVFFLFFISSILFAQKDQLKFIHFSVEQNLSQSTVKSIKQDYKGFLWIGTDAGLNRFDGYKFKIYSYEMDNPNAFQSSKIQVIFEDSDKNLWVGTDGGGIYKYNRDMDVFTKFGNDKNGKQLISSEHINCIYEDDKNLWIGTDIGLNKIEKENGQIKQYNIGSSGNNIISICGAGKGNLWIGKESGGVDKFYPQSGRAIQLININNINKVYRDSRRFLWIGSEDQGLIKYEEDKNKFTYYKNSKRDRYSLSDNFVMDIYEDSRGKLWIGTYSGLNIFDYSDNKFYSYKNDKDDPASLGSDIINVIYEDREGVMWIGTQNAGIAKCIFYTRKFEHYLNRSGNFDGNTILSIYEDNDENIWVGSFGGGLIKIDRKNDSKKIYLNNPGNINSISSDLVVNIYENKKGSFWIATGNGGLNKFNRDTDSFISYKKTSDPFSISGNFVTIIYEDEDDKLWVGTYGSGLNLFDLKTGKFYNWRQNSSDSLSISNDYINSFIKDSRNDFWIGTIDGLNKFDKTKKIFHRQKFVKNDSYDISKYEIQIVFEDSQKRFWIGTYNGGLNFFDRDRNTITNFSVKDGLPSNDIYGILEDENGNLWISTQNGISKFNYERKEFTNFTVLDGLQNNEFSQNGFYKSKKGKMYFGGVNGFNAFYPSEIIPNKKIPRIQTTEFKLFNNVVALTPTSAIKKNITEVDTINLSYNENSFSFEFASLSLVNPSQNQYAYMLEGYDEDWNKTNSEFRIASYTNINSGEYIFRVKGTNNDGLWNEEGRNIVINISTAPWKTWWAYLSYLIFISFGIWGIVKYQVKRTKKIELLKSEEREKIRKEMAEDFHDGTGDKLAQISLFSKFVKAQIKSESAEIDNALEWIAEASDNLKKETKDFLWALDAGVNSLYDVGLRLKEHGFSFFKKSATGVDFEITGLENSFSKILLPMDWKRNLLFIFKEAMSNSFKYSKCTKVNIEFSINENELVIKYSDNGESFDISFMNEGHGIKNMNRRAEKIKATLTITAEPTKGTVIIFTGRIPSLIK